MSGKIDDSVTRKNFGDNLRNLQKSAGPAAMERSTRLVVLALFVIHLFGVISMYGLIYRNGYYNALIKLRDHGPYVLPGSDTPILMTYTSIPYLDSLLRLASVMFCNVTDGSSPALSLYAFHFAGQLVPVITIMLVEDLRRSNGGPMLLHFVVWGCLMQSVGYGIIMPLCCICQLVSVRIAKTDAGLGKLVRLADITALEAIPRSISLGYILPAVLMCLPFPSSAPQQWLGGIWQGFPVWLSLIHWLTRHIHPNDRTSPRLKATTRNSADGRAAGVMALDRVYQFAFTIATLTHTLSIVLLLVRAAYPSVFPPQLRESWTFSKVFVPPWFTSQKQMPDMAAGILGFFQYDQYVGSAAAMIWAMALHCSARQESMTLKDWLGLTGEVFMLSLLAGPTGAMISLIWRRDEQINRPRHRLRARHLD